MHPYRVIVVVDRSFGTRTRELPENTPAWIVDSAVNHPAILDRSKTKSGETHPNGITSFRDLPDMSPSARAASMISTIEEHHGRYSHNPPMSRLTVLGAAADPELLTAVESIGFRLVTESNGILEFAAREEPNQTYKPTPTA